MTSSSACLVWRVWPVLSFIGDKILSNNTKMRHRTLILMHCPQHTLSLDVPCRLFGPFGFGPKEDQEQLMRAVVKRRDAAQQK